MAKTTKNTVEIQLLKLELTGLPEKRLLKSRHLGTIELIWPRAGIAKKAASRRMDLRLGKADFTQEPWAKRTIFREDIDGHCGIAISISDALTLQKIRKYLKLVLKYALKEGADFVGSAMVGYADIATAPVDAMAAMVGTTEAPKSIAQGIFDITELPSEGSKMTIDIPLTRPLTGANIGTITLELSV